MEPSNKDGGAHVDPYLNEDYANLMRNNSIGWSVTTDTSEEEENLLDIGLYSARQIAFELPTSINRYFDQIPFADYKLLSTSSYYSLYKTEKICARNGQEPSQPHPLRVTFLFYLITRKTLLNSKPLQTALDQRPIM